MARLKPRALEILMLRYQRDYSDAQIAALLGTSRGVIAVTLYRIRARLRTLLRFGRGQRETRHDLRRTCAERPDWPATAVPPGVCRRPRPRAARVASHADRAAEAPHRRRSATGAALANRAAAPLAAAAAIILPLSRSRFDGMQRPAATMSARVTQVRAGDAGRMLTLDDGSRVEMRAQSELSIERATDGIGIRLLTGDIIVNAAKQRDGHLYVHTKDMTVAVVGTVFLVNAGNDGSRVAVIEGEVSVREGDTETRLRPGEQVATSPTLARRPMRDDIIWSRNADAHLAILESFTKGMAQTAGPLAVTLNSRPDGPAAGSGVRGGVDPGVRSRQPAADAAGRARWRCQQLLHDARAHLRAVHDAGRDGSHCVRLRAMPDGSLSADTRPGTRLEAEPGVSDRAPNAGIAVRGGPDWARNERYSIEAVAGDEADADTMSGPMFRALLERPLQAEGARRDRGGSGVDADGRRPAV